MNPTGLDSAFPNLSSKIGFIQFGALNQSGLIFETGYRSVFEIKWKRFNSNNWAAREKLLGRPAKRSAPAGCLSGCPHSSVTWGWAKRYGATWIVRSSSNPTAGGHRRRETSPARTKPSAASGGRRRLTGAQARVGDGVERRSRRRRTQGWSRQLLGWLQSLAPFFSGSGRLQ